MCNILFFNFKNGFKELNLAFIVRKLVLNEVYIMTFNIPYIIDVVVF